MGKPLPGGRGTRTNPDDVALANRLGSMPLLESSGKGGSDDEPPRVVTGPCRAAWALAASLVIGTWPGVAKSPPWSLALALCGALPIGSAAAANGSSGRQLNSGRAWATCLLWKEGRTFPHWPLGKV